jgi:hypothetical protein
MKKISVNLVYLVKTIIDRAGMITSCIWDATNAVIASSIWETTNAVIASAAKQSLTINASWDRDCFVATLLAMTTYEKAFWDSRGKKIFAPTSVVPPLQ